MSDIRRPAVAGMFYPGDARELRTMVQSFLGPLAMGAEAPKAIIAPHAGYIYSGPVAATAYRALAKARAEIRRIVLLGPSHRLAFDGLALSSARYFATPLGNIPVDRAACDAIRDLPQVHVLDEAHAMEHSLEVHLPFLQLILDEFSVVPLVVGDAAPAVISEVLERLWDGPQTRFVVSSDLSHYHDYQTAKYLDEATSRAIEKLRFEDIGYDHACGRNPISGLLNLARAHGLQGRTLDQRNSGDTAGPRDQVVGYGAYAFSEAASEDKGTRAERGS
ncbi:MAG: AmmeMemoRadiSam system protein B [Gammaproteobacteria bacterium]